MSNFKYFIGTDISKLTIDVAVLDRAETCLYACKVSNSFEGLQGLFTILRTSYKIKSRDCLICAEDMGVYATHLTSMAISKKLNLWLESPLRIKRTLGIQRQKNDAYDALQIAKYALRNVNDTRLWQPPRICIQKLKSLTTIRKRLLKVGRMLTNSGKLDTFFLAPSEALFLREYSQDSVIAVEQDVNRVNLDIRQTILNDQPLRRLFEIVTSVPGIGPVTAVEIIVSTNEFKGITTARKFASYCGVAPFKRESGISLSSRNKVSQLAGKELKSLLHLAALIYARSDKYALGRYYLRKTAEGKNRMSVLNAVRNKIIHRIYACVQGNKLFADI